jgi:hypothetical protein
MPTRNQWIFGASAAAALATIGVLSLWYTDSATPDTEEPPITHAAPRSNIDLQREADFNIPQGPLVDGLEKIFQSLNVSGGFRSDDMNGVQGNAVIGRFRVEAALDKLLAGTGCHKDVIVQSSMLWLTCKTPKNPR